MQTKLFKEIITSRLVIRPVTIEDTDRYFDAEQASLKILTPHSNWIETEKSFDRIKKFIEEAIEINKKENPPKMYFSVFSKADNQYLGMLWFSEINWLVPSFEIDYWLDMRVSGRGYMIEALNALTKICFDLYGAKRVQIKPLSN